MVLTALLKSLEPRSFEIKTFLATSLTGIVGALADNNFNLLLVGPLAVLPLYFSLRLTRSLDYLANLRFDNFPHDVSKEEFERILKEPIKQKPESPDPKFYLDRIRILYKLR